MKNNTSSPCQTNDEENPISIKKKRMAAVLNRLIENTKDVQFGSVSVLLKIHGGRICDVLYTTSENTREANG